MIEKMNIPTYKKAYEAQSDYSFLGCTKRITYNVNEVKNSFNILYLYRDYFLSNGWKQYDSENVGDWFDNKLFYSWIDNTGEMLAKLVIVSDSKIKNTKLVKQTVYLNVTPYLITRWPTTEKVDTACRP